MNYKLRNGGVFDSRCPIQAILLETLSEAGESFADRIHSSHNRGVAAELWKKAFALQGMFRGESRPLTAEGVESESITLSQLDTLTTPEPDHSIVVRRRLNGGPSGSDINQDGCPVLQVGNQDGEPSFDTCADASRIGRSLQPTWADPPGASTRTCGGEAIGN